MDIWVQSVILRAQMVRAFILNTNPYMYIICTECALFFSQFWEMYHTNYLSLHMWKFSVQIVVTLLLIGDFNGFWPANSCMLVPRAVCLSSSNHLLHLHEILGDNHAISALRIQIFLPNIVSDDVFCFWSPRTKC